jgi:hypothetical protein
MMFHLAAAWPIIWQMRKWSQQFFDMNCVDSAYLGGKTRNGITLDTLE